jgi:hypothetical protein
MTDDTLKPKPRGRPRLAAPMTPVATRLPPAEYDRLIKSAAQQDTSIAALVRQMLRLRLPKV